MTHNWNRGGRTYRGFSQPVRRRAKRQLPAACNWCNAEDVDLELDHIVPHSQGGTDTLDNAQWLCIPCHADKTNSERTAGIRARRTSRRHRTAAAHPADFL